MASDKDLLVLAAWLADKNKSSIFTYYSLLLLKCLSSVITIRLHCCDANTSLFLKEKEKEMNP